MINYLNHLRQSTLILLGLIMVSCIAMLDYVTGTELSFSIFYFLPIVLASWFVGRRCGLVFVFLCSFTWGAAEYFGEDQQVLSFAFLFNAAVRLGIFITIAVLIDRLRDSSEKLLAEKSKKETLLENFVSLVKHELRNAAGSVKIMLGILAQEKLTKDQLELIRDIGEENDRVEDTINTLSLLARSRDAREQFETVALSELIPQILQRLNSEKKVIIKTTTEGPCLVASPRNILVHILENVISNAIKYSKDGGTVLLKLYKEKGAVFFSCTDGGIGIPEKELPYLFDPFYRGSNAAHKKGSGVGLFVTKQLLERVGGTISVSSRINEGTQITIYFPAAASSTLV